MKLMHTKLPDFYKKAVAAGKKLRSETEVTVRGMENLKSAKLASLRVGRVEDEILEITQDPRVAKVEVIVLPRNPETMNTVIIKGIQKDGSCKKAILESMFITTPPEDCELYDVEEIDDRRIPLS
ncbi:MAG: hypothetical protein KHZ62_00760 [Clostridiales bacterium]|nr:hypothetical protein [Clostridiales bacterium]